MFRTLTALAVAATVLAGCGEGRKAPTTTEEDLPRVTGVLSTKSAKALFGAQSVGSPQSAASFGSGS